MGRFPAIPLLCAALGAATVLAPRDLAIEPAAPAGVRNAALTTMGARPLAFERNDGQTDPRVAFVARAPGGAVFVQKDGLTIQPRGAGRAPLRLAFEGGGATRVDGVERLPGHVNYLKGDDPSKWRTDVPLFARAVCRGAWPGIDVVVRGAGRELEYDFEVAPGADPSAIAMRFDGADSVAVEGAGDLVVRVGGEEFRHLRPRAFQDGREIAGAFAAAGDGRVGFSVEGRDPSRTLVIDPVVAFATYVGGRDDETPYDAAVDAGGDVYVAGAVVSIDFPVANELPGQPGGGGVDAFVTKLNASGAKFLYSTYYGGNGVDTAWGVRVDPTGIYLAGSTTSPDFPSINALQPALKGGVSEGDAFLAKLTPSGSTILFSTFLGGSGDDGCRALSVDNQRNCYVGGFTNSPDFPTTAGAAQRTLNGLADGWTARVSANGAALSWSTYVGGSAAAEAVQGIAVDGSLNTFACGYTASDDFPLGAGGFRVGRAGGVIDGFLLKLDAAGAVTAGTYVGGSADDNCRRVVADSSGRPYVAGFTLSSDLPTVNPVQSAFYGGNGTGDGFVAEFEADLSAPVFSTYFGGSDDDDVQGLALGPDRSVYLAGNTRASFFPLVDPVQATFGGTRDAFAAKLAPAGTSVTWSTYFGGAGYEAAKGLAVDSNGSAYLAVSAQNAGLPTFCAAQPEYGGGRDDVYVVKIAEDSSAVPSRPLFPAAVATSAYQVDVAWADTSNNECLFRVERRDGDGEFAPVASLDTNVTTFADTGVEPDRTYAYRVFAVNPLGESEASDEATVSTPATVVVSPRIGALVETWRARRDRVRIFSLLRFNGFSNEHAFRLPRNSMRFEVGAAGDPLVIEIPADDKRWRRRRNVMTWTSARRVRPVVRVDVKFDAVSPTLTLRAAHFDFPTTPNGDLYLSVRSGTDAGHVERAWTPLKRSGRFRLP